MLPKVYSYHKDAASDAVQYSYAYGPGTHQGGTPCVTARIVFIRKARSHALSLSVLALHASGVRRARDSRCNQM